MSLLIDFAEWFKSRQTKIQRWYRDDVGRYAFRVNVDGQAFICTARSSTPNGGQTSIMQRIAGRAQTTNALILLRTPGRMYVFDPVTVLAHGERDDPTEDDRLDRGEEWVAVNTDIACDFEAWFDGEAEPVRVENLETF